MLAFLNEWLFLDEYFPLLQQLFCMYRCLILLFLCIRFNSTCVILQINASDERSASAIETRILDVVQMNSVTADSRPKCLVCFTYSFIVFELDYSKLFEVEETDDNLCR